MAERSDDTALAGAILTGEGRHRQQPERSDDETPRRGKTERLHDPWETAVHQRTREHSLNGQGRPIIFGDECGW